MRGVFKLLAVGLAALHLTAASAVPLEAKRVVRPPPSAIYPAIPINPPNLVRRDTLVEPVRPPPSAIIPGKIIDRRDDAVNITERDRPQACRKWTELIGNGNPRDVFRHKQLTQKLYCDPSNDCSVTYTTGLSIDFSLELGIAYEWISGGFSVSIGYHVDQSYQCDAKDGQPACVWHSAAYKAYDVRNKQGGDCFEDFHPGPDVIKSPIPDNVGGKGYYCVVGAAYCRDINALYWDDTP